jgi:hypothetical protein
MQATRFTEAGDDLLRRRALLRRPLGQFRSTRLIVGTLAFGTLMFAGGLARLLTLPFL